MEEIEGRWNFVNDRINIASNYIRKKEKKKI